MPQFVKKYPAPVVAQSHEFPCNNQSIEHARMAGYARCCAPLLLNAAADTLCNGVEAVGQFENTENDGACTSLKASFLLWLLMLSISLEGCHANCNV